MTLAGIAYDRRSNILRLAALVYMPHITHYDSASADCRRQTRAVRDVRTCLAAAARKERLRVLNRRVRLVTAVLAAALLAVGGRAPASAVQSMTRADYEACQARD